MFTRNKKKRGGREKGGYVVEGGGGCKRVELAGVWCGWVEALGGWGDSGGGRRGENVCDWHFRVIFWGVC